MSKYTIVTKEKYHEGLEAGVKLQESISKHSPIFSPDGKEVLIKGIGKMTIDEVNAYIKENWTIEDELDTFPEDDPSYIE